MMDRGSVKLSHSGMASCWTASSNHNPAKRCARERADGMTGKWCGSMVHLSLQDAQPAFGCTDAGACLVTDGKQPMKQMGRACWPMLCCWRMLLALGKYSLIQFMALHYHQSSNIWWSQLNKGKITGLRQFVSLLRLHSYSIGLLLACTGFDSMF